jgi:hypothetical protein
VGASSRKRDEPQLVGEVVLGRNGVRSLDLRPPRRVNPPDLTAAERAGHLARGAARRARRLLGG